MDRNLHDDDEFSEQGYISLPKRYQTSNALQIETSKYANFTFSPFDHFQFRPTLPLAEMCIPDPRVCHIYIFQRINCFAFKSFLSTILCI